MKPNTLVLTMDDSYRKCSKYTWFTLKCMIFTWYRCTAFLYILLVHSVTFLWINFKHEKSNLTEILTDGIILEKNLILLKNLNGLDRNELGGKEPVFIDVWPVSILDSDQILTDGHFDFDESSLFLLQLGKYQSQQISHVIGSNRLFILYKIIQ